MKIQPVTSSKPPAYPPQDWLVSHPELLSRFAPRRWLRHKAVWSALSAFVLAGLANCKSRTDARPSADEPVALDSAHPAQEERTPSTHRCRVAPIFAHGNGAGSTGCMAMSPPVYLSELEAMRIIREEFAKERIALDTENVPSFPLKRNGGFERDKDSIDLDDCSPKVLWADGYVPGKKLLIKYVASEDARKLSAHPMGDGIETRIGAERLREELLRDDEYNTAIFYDPMPHSHLFDRDTPKGGLSPQDSSRVLLLAQVRDFIAWAKKEGVLE